MDQVRTLLKFARVTFTLLLLSQAAIIALLLVLHRTATVMRHGLIHILTP